MPKPEMDATRSGYDRHQTGYEVSVHERPSIIPGRRSGRVTHVSIEASPRCTSMLSISSSRLWCCCLPSACTSRRTPGWPTGWAIPTAKMLGRVSLNPIVHIDPVRNHPGAGAAGAAGLSGVWLGETDSGGFAKFQEPGARRHTHGGSRPGQQLHHGFCVGDDPGSLRARVEPRSGGMFRGTDVAGPLAQMFELAILDQRGARRYSTLSRCRRWMAATSSATFFRMTRCACMTGSATSGWSSSCSCCR